jgi:hypothetical protein
LPPIDLLFAAGASDAINVDNFFNSHIFSLDS